MPLDREYISVKETAERMRKSPRRIYQMVQEGVLLDVGFTVYRQERGRIWVGFPNAAFSSLCLEKGGT